jgi:septal ring factor EnvC (AmiA/AmiB activator)
MGATLPALLIGAGVLIGVTAAPGALRAYVAPPEPGASERLEPDRLGEVRGQLERRRALQRQLQARADALAAEIAALEAQGEQTAAALQSERQQVRVLEQRLDHLVPRLLARLAEMDARRTQTARVLAELAIRSRSLRLAPTVRARMLALSPVMLERLRSLENGVAELRGRPDRVIEHRGEIERTMAELLATQRDVAQGQAQKRLERQMAANRLRAVDVEMRRLSEEETRLARGTSRDGVAVVARAEPRAERRGLPDMGATHAAGGRATSTGRAAHAGRGAYAWQDVVGAGKPDPGPAAGAAELAAARGWAAFPPSAGPATAALRGGRPPSWPRASRDAVGRAARPDVAVAPGRGPSGRGGTGVRGAPPPILTVPDSPRERGLIAHGGPELTIAAKPGQAVAAPVEGRVAFAGNFKSYGLLLILEHQGEYHTLLWGFARLDVRQGEQVQVGRIVGIMDASGDDPPVLHVERRRNGRPVDIAASSNGIQG